MQQRKKVSHSLCLSCPLAISPIPDTSSLRFLPEIVRLLKHTVLVTYRCVTSYPQT